MKSLRTPAILYIFLLCIPLLVSSISLRDDRGRSVTLSHPPRRIVSLSPATTEMLFALGAGRKVVGVTSYCNYPPTARRLPKVGGYINPNLEAVVALKPDLVVGMRGNPISFLNRLEGMGIPVFALDPRSVSQVLEGMRRLGRLVGEERKAEEVVKGLKARLEKVERAVKRIPYSKRPRVFVEIWDNPLITFGPSSVGGEVIKLAGGRNIAEDSKVSYPQISLETLIRRNPDVIILAHMVDKKPLEEIKKRENWNRIRAVQEGRVYLIDADIMNRPGPRLVQAVEEIHKMLYGK